MWIFNTTPEHIRCCEELNLSRDVRDAIQRWAVSVGRTPTHLQKPLFRTDDNVYEMWVARLPDPDSSKGKSGGFRLIYFFNLHEKSIYADQIERRDDKGGRNERPRDQQKATAYVDSMKRYLSRLAAESISNNQTVNNAKKSGLDTAK